MIQLSEKYIGLAKRHWKVVTISTAIVVCSMSYIVYRGTNATKTTYQTATVTKGTIVSTITASGKALSTSILPISTTTSGIVKKVYVKDGDKAYKGQKIAEITPDTDGELANAKAYASLQSALNGYRSSQATLANTLDQLKGHELDESFSQKETRTKVEFANDNAWNGLAQARLPINKLHLLLSPHIQGRYLI